MENVILSTHIIVGKLVFFQEGIHNLHTKVMDPRLTPQSHKRGMGAQYSPT